MIGVGTVVTYVGDDLTLKGLQAEVIATNVLGCPTAVTLAFEGRFLHVTTSTRNVTTLS